MLIVGKAIKKSNFWLAASVVNVFLGSSAHGFSSWKQLSKRGSFFSTDTTTRTTTSSSSSTSIRRKGGTIPFFPLAAAVRNDTDTPEYSSTTTTTTTPTTTTTRINNVVLSEIGLEGHYFRHAANIPSIRKVSPQDIFCNRELRMSAIQAMGFDMDYTLAQYHQPAFDLLAYQGAKDKLVTLKGYPDIVRELHYDHEFFTRGLIIDTRLGNFLKIDRHKYVRVAYHGFNPISSITRKHLYSKAFNKVISFSEKHFVNMDTLFQFVDAHLFASLIDMKDQGDHDVLHAKTYEEIYRDVRECVDLCHRDGVIKDEVARNPHPFIVKDNNLVPMLKRYRQEGMKLFLLTNSHWPYTSTVMNYLYYGKRVDDELQKENNWLELFDLVIVGSCKPAYMLDPYLNLFRVNPQDGSLQNTDGIYEIDALGSNGASKFLAQGKTFQGGNWLHLHAMLECAGDEILYVGDHLYSDVLRSKRTLGWRSAFIVPELVDEMRVFHENKELFRKITAVRRLRDELDIHADEIRSGYQTPLFSPGEQETILDEILEEEKQIKDKLAAMAEAWHGAFHPIWGALFSAGYQDSRFAFYVQNYACLYTSQATNFGLVSTVRHFRTTEDVLPHDRLLLDDQTVTFVDTLDHSLLSSHPQVSPHPPN